MTISRNCGKTEIITRAITKNRGEKERIQEELTELEKKLPGLMAQLYLERGSSKDEVSGIKKRRAEFRESLEECELTFEGLRAELASLKDEEQEILRKASESANIQQEIEGLKKRILEFSANRMGGTDRVGQIEHYMREILRLAERIHCQEDAKSFLQTLNDWRLAECRQTILDTLEGQARSKS